MSIYSCKKYFLYVYNACLCVHVCACAFVCFVPIGLCMLCCVGKRKRPSSLSQRKMGCFWECRCARAYVCVCAYICGYMNASKENTTGFMGPRTRVRANLCNYQWPMRKRQWARNRYVTKDIHSLTSYLIFLFCYLYIYKYKTNENLTS